MTEKKYKPDVDPPQRHWILNIHPDESLLDQVIDATVMFNETHPPHCISRKGIQYRLLRAYYEDDMASIARYIPSKMISTYFVEWVNLIRINDLAVDRVEPPAIISARKARNEAFIKFIGGRHLNSMLIQELLLAFTAGVDYQWKINNDR